MKLAEQKKKRKKERREIQRWNERRRKHLKERDPTKPSIYVFGDWIEAEKVWKHRHWLFSLFTHASRCCRCWSWWEKSARIRATKRRNWRIPATFRATTPTLIQRWWRRVIRLSSQRAPATISSLDQVKMHSIFYFLWSSFAAACVLSGDYLLLHHACMCARFLDSFSPCWLFRIPVPTCARRLVLSRSVMSLTLFNPFDSRGARERERRRSNMMGRRCRNYPFTAYPGWSQLWGDVVRPELFNITDILGNR